MDGFTEMYAVLSWRALCTLAAKLLPGGRAPQRDELVYRDLRDDYSSAEVGTAKVLVTVSSRILAGFEESSSTAFQWNSVASGAVVSVCKLSPDHWAMSFAGPEGCEYHRLVRAAELASATEFAV